jgi:hypothetical protein
MNGSSLNWLRFSMVALLLLTTFAVSWNLFADIKTTNLKIYSQDRPIKDSGPVSSQYSRASAIERREKSLTTGERNLDNPANKKEGSVRDDKKSIQTIQDLVWKPNSADIEFQAEEIGSSQMQNNEASDYSGLIASISDVTGYSVPFERELVYPLEEMGFFAGISSGRSSSERSRNPEEKGSTVENPENPQIQELEEGLLIQSSEKDGVKVEDAWYNGVNVVKAHHGLNVRQAYGEGVNVSFAHNDGFNLDSADVNGVDIDHVGDDGIQIFRAGKDGLVIYNAEEEGIDAIGDRGNLLRSNSPAFHGLYVHSYGSSPSNPGLYVAGTFYATGTKSSVVKTSRGDEALYAMESPEVEFVASGTGQLAGGECYVTFDRLFQEAISKEIPLRIILTPKDTWSGLYVAEKSHRGFRVKAVGGEVNAEFDWLAIGRRKGYEKRPDSPLPKK